MNGKSKYLGQHRSCNIEIFSLLFFSFVLYFPCNMLKKQFVFAFMTYQKLLQDSAATKVATVMEFFLIL